MINHHSHKGIRRFVGTDLRRGEERRDVLQGDIRDLDVYRLHLEEGDSQDLEDSGRLSQEAGVNPDTNDMVRGEDLHRRDAGGLDLVEDPDRRDEIKKEGRNLGIGKAAASRGAIRDDLA